MWEKLLGEKEDEYLRLYFKKVKKYHFELHSVIHPPYNRHFINMKTAYSKLLLRLNTVIGGRRLHVIQYFLVNNINLHVPRKTHWPNNRQTSTDICHASTAAVIVTDLFHNSITGQIDVSDTIILIGFNMSCQDSVQFWSWSKNCRIKGYGNIINILLFRITGKNLWSKYNVWRYIF